MYTIVLIDVIFYNRGNIILIVPMDHRTKILLYFSKFIWSLNATLNVFHFKPKGMHLSILQPNTWLNPKCSQKNGYKQIRVLIQNMWPQITSYF